MRFFIPSILVLLVVFQSEFSFGQNYGEKYFSEIDSLISNGQFDEAEMMIRQSIKNKEELSITNFGDELFKLSISKKSMGLYSVALQKADSALHYFTLENNQHKIAETLLLKGKLYNLLDNYIGAINILKKSEITFKKEKDTINLGIVKMNMGNIHFNMFNIEESANYYHEAIYYFKSLNLEKSVGNCYNNIGNLYHRSNQLDSSKLYYEKTLAIAVNSNNKGFLSAIYHNYGVLHLAMGDFASALFYTNKSVTIDTEISDFMSLQNNYLVLGEIFYAMLDFNLAIEYLHKSIVNTKDFYTQHNSDSYLLIAKCYSDIEKFEEATYHFNRYLLINDSIYKRKNSSPLESQFIKYSLSRSELIMRKELSEIEKNNLILESELIKNKTNFLFTVLVLTLGFGILLFFSFRKRLKQSNSHKEILEDQNEELKRTLISKKEKETLLKEIHHRVKNNLQIINSLIRLQSYYMSPTNYKAKLEDTENRIRSMALVHEKLYNSRELSKLDSESYIIELAQNLKSAYEINENIELNFNIKKIQLSIDTLIPLGLIINEIISNSLKYGFTGLEGGEIKIELEQEKGIKLTISDNGIGADLSYEELSEDSLGMELIDSLCSQLNGEFNLVTENGFCYTFTFDKFE